MLVRTEVSWKMSDADTEETMDSFRHLLFSCYIWYLIVYYHFHGGYTLSHWRRENSQRWPVTVFPFVYVSLVQMVFTDSRATNLPFVIYRKAVSSANFLPL